MRLRNVLIVKYCGYEMIVIWLQAFRLRDRCYERFNCKTLKNSKVLTNIIFRKTCFAAKTNYSNCLFLTYSRRDGFSCEGIEPISRFVQLCINKQKRLFGGASLHNIERARFLSPIVILLSLIKAADSVINIISVLVAYFKKNHADSFFAFF